ncbi:ArsR/SmtB family transcription factor [Amycolatopsis lurida]
MYHLRFTVEDLARTRIASTVDPVVETLFAVELLARNGGGDEFAAWRERTHARLGQRGRSLVNLARVVRPVPDLLSMVEHPGAVPDPTGKLAKAKRHNVFSAIHAFHKVAVAPYWPRLRAQIDADTAARGRLILDGGIERFLEILHPTAQWSCPTLSIPSPRDQEVVLDGRGLVLVPSLFLADRPGVLIDTTGDDRPPTLAFGVPLDRAAAGGLWGTATATETARPLGALVGRTRAAIIRTLTESCTTSELARRINISAAAASQHTAVLREAGLITTHRRLNTALHTLTPLGVALLNGFDAPDLCAALGQPPADNPVAVGV